MQSSNLVCTTRSYATCLVVYHHCYRSLLQSFGSKSMAVATDMCSGNGAVTRLNA
jgi:hypothetical protein